jgi:hypothetical protein
MTKVGLRGKHRHYQQAFLNHFKLPRVLRASISPFPPYSVQAQGWKTDISRRVATVVTEGFEIRQPRTSLLEGTLCGRQENGTEAIPSQIGRKKVGKGRHPRPIWGETGSVPVPFFGLFRMNKHRQTDIFSETK